LSNHNGITVEPNSNRNYRKYSNTRRLNNILLNDQWVPEEIRGETLKFLESNENENTDYQNLWDTAKAVLRGKIICISVYMKKKKGRELKEMT
jgi:hypothetical protein